MNRRLIALCLCALACSPVLAQDKEPPPPAKAEQPTEKVHSYVVVDVSGELQLVKVKELKAFKKQLSKDHKAAIKSHAAAKKEAKKAKEKFTEPKPKTPKVKVLSKKALPEAEAQALLDKITEERRKKAEKKRRK